MRNRLLVALLAGLLVIIAAYYSHAQIVGGDRNPAGEWCCGIADCGMVEGTAVHAQPGGYLVDGFVSYFKEPSHSTGNKLGPFDHSEWVREKVPYSQTQPSPDGAYWRCKRPDGSMRCFFAPPPGS